MRGLPFFKPKNKPQFAGMNFSNDASGGGGGGGSIDKSALANKTDITAIILTGTTNTSGNVISAGTWFYLNGKPCMAKVDIASGATFTEGTNYEEKTVGSALSELNSNIVEARIVIPANSYLYANDTWYTTPSDGYVHIGFSGVTTQQGAKVVMTSSDKTNKIEWGVQTVAGELASFYNHATFVKKGMLITNFVAPSSEASVSFFPLT